MVLGVRVGPVIALVLPDMGYPKYGVLLPSKVDKESFGSLPFSCILKACSQYIHVR